MGLQINRTPNEDVALNVFQKIYEDVPGGLLLNRDEFRSDVNYAPKGAPVEYDLSTRKATLVKTAEVYENANDTATDIKIKKNHNFKVGDIVAKAVDGAAYAITEIDTSNSDYDVITVGTTLGVALTAGDVLFESSAEGASAGAEAHEANGFLLSAVDITGANASCSVAIRATVIESQLPYPVTEKNKESLTSRIAFV